MPLIRTPEPEPERSAPAPGETIMRGKISNVFYTDWDELYMAGELTLEGTHDVIRFAGDMQAALGAEVELIGEWRVHARFGNQFYALDFNYL